MAKVLRYLMFSFLLVIICNAYAQNEKFEGTVRYSLIMDTTGVKGIPAQAVSMMKSMEIIYKIKGDHFRMDSKTMVSNTAVIADNKKQTAFTLMDMMGYKYLIKITPEDMKKEMDSPAPKIKFLDATKEIAGYICKKAEVTVPENQLMGEYTTTVFYTDKIPNVKGYGAKFKELDGFPLEYSIEINGMKIHVAATSVTKEKIEEETFLIPKGYKETTLEGLQEDMKKNMGAK